MPGGFDFGDLGNLNMDGIFGDLLRGFGIRTGERGDLKKEIVITFEEAAFGAEKELTYERTEACKDCRGSGSERGHLRETCSACMGRGRVRFQQGIFPVAIDRTCSRCHGTGKLVTHPCAACRGAGLVAAARTITVTIPPGIEHGATRTVERGGNLCVPIARPGDLELTVAVAPHPFFKRSGDDVTCSVPVSFVQAALGGELEVPTLEGQRQAEDPCGDPTGHVLRIKGKGSRAASAAGAATAGRGHSRGADGADRTSARPVGGLGQGARGRSSAPAESFVQKLKDFFG